ncbi:MULTISPECIES: nitroreductase family protein [Aminobacterium]|jgi:nitroreductase|uniref:nitroreductase family protein n=1 Tax=Aminobacterium TaxID=81466 RepID=UPI0025798185|nr:nitroreductase family protein [Aminobacterium sp. UBA4987]
MDKREHPVIKAILGRRSIRKFTTAPVEKEIIDILLECAFAAPSAHNQRPCHFIVIQERDILDRLAAAHDSGKMLAQAPLAIAVCADTSFYPKEDLAWMEDAAAALENILLGARPFGIEGVWLKVMGRHPREERVCPILEVPDHIKVTGIAALGYPAEEKAPHKGVNDKALHKEKW